MKRNEKKANRKRRLLLLILLLVLTLCVGSVGTYAWFTSNKVVNVNDMEVNVRAVNGLEISADAASWGVKVDKNMLINNEFTGHKNQLPDSLGAVSTVGALNSSNLIQMYYGSVATVCEGGGTDCDNPRYALTTSTQGEDRCYDTLGGEANEGNNCTGKYFMAFDIFLKVDRDAYLYLTQNAGVTSSGDDLGIKNASRVAFLVQGHIPYTEYYNEYESGTGPSVTRAQDLSGSQDSQVVIWEPNSDAHTSYGVLNATNNYGVAGLTAGTGNAYVAYKGVKEAFNDVNNPVYLDETEDTKNEAYFGDVNPHIITNVNMVESNTGITLLSGVTKVRVYYWVEGQDVDAENNATGSNMKLSLEFTIKDM